MDRADYNSDTDFLEVAKLTME